MLQGQGGGRGEVAGGGSQKAQRGRGCRQGGRMGGRRETQGADEGHSGVWTAGALLRPPSTGPNPRWCYCSGTLHSPERRLDGRLAPPPSNRRYHSRPLAALTSHQVCCGRVGPFCQERSEGLEVAFGSSHKGGSAAALHTKAWVNCGRGRGNVERGKRKEKGKKKEEKGGLGLRPPPPLPTRLTSFASSVDPPSSKAACSATTSPALAAA